MARFLGHYNGLVERAFLGVQAAALTAALLLIIGARKETK